MMRLLGYIGEDWVIYELYQYYHCGSEQSYTNVAKSCSEAELTDSLYSVA